MNKEIDLWKIIFDQIEDLIERDQLGETKVVVLNNDSVMPCEAHKCERKLY